MRKNIIAIVSAAAALASCSSPPVRDKEYCIRMPIDLYCQSAVPMADKLQDAQMKTFLPKSNVASIYIYRGDHFVGSLVRMGVEVDGAFIGYSANRTYFYKEVSAGSHSIRSKAENEDTLTFDTVAGKLYFVWQDSLMGMDGARTKLHLVSEEEGKRGVLAAQLAESK